MLACDGYYSGCVYKGDGDDDDDGSRGGGGGDGGFD